MAAPVITLEEAKEHLRVDHTDDDADIQRKVDQASAIVVDYIKKPADWAPTDTETKIFQAAALMVLSKLYDDRNVGEEDAENVALGYLTLQVTAILHRMRDPALA